MGAEVSSSLGRAAYEGVGLPVWWGAHPKFGGCSPTRAGEAGTLGLRRVFCPAHVRAKNGFEIIPPAAAGGSLRRLPSRARGVGRSVFGSPTGQDLAGCSVGRSAAGRLRRVPYRASPWDGVFSGALWGESGWVIPSDGALRGDCGVCPPGRVRWTERLAKVCDAFWVRCGNGFPAAGPCFRFGGNFFGSCPHIWQGSSVIQGERGRSHHGLGGPI